MKSSEINIGSIKINAIGKACHFTISPSIQTNINNTRKRNQGFGEENSDHSRYFNPKQIVVDADLFDSVSVLNDLDEEP